MAKFFISYSRADRLFVDTFLPHLRRVYGQDCAWFDDHISGGADWWQSILNEIGACRVFLFLCSEESLESPYCAAELQEAIRLNKPVLPVIVRAKTDYPGDVIAPDLANFLQRTQYVDLSDGMQDTDALMRLVGAANRMIETSAPVQSQSPVFNPQPTANPTRMRRLEAAMPQESPRKTITEIRVKVVLPDSEGLRAELPVQVPSGEEIQKEDVRSTGFPITFPVDPASGRLQPVTVCVRVKAPAFDILDTPPDDLCGEGFADALDVLPEYDSRTAIIQMQVREDAPAGRQRVSVDIVHNGRIIAEASVMTRVTEEQSAVVAYAFGTATMAFAGHGTAEVPRMAARPDVTDEYGEYETAPPTPEPQPSKSARDEQARSREEAPKAAPAPMPAPAYGGAPPIAPPSPDFGETAHMGRKRAPRRMRPNTLTTVGVAVMTLVFVGLLATVFFNRDMASVEDATFVAAAATTQAFSIQATSQAGEEPTETPPPTATRSLIIRTPIIVITPILPNLTLIPNLTFVAPCRDTLPTRLEDGDVARVIPRRGLSLHTQPDEDSRTLTTVPVNATVAVVDSFRCADGYLWRSVIYTPSRSERYEGWLIEADDQTYFLSPTDDRQ